MRPELSGTIRRNDDAATRLKLATADILPGARRSTSWGGVNANGVDGGIAYAESWTLTSAKSATWTAPTLPSPSGGSYYAVRVPVGSNRRNYAIREPSNIFDPIDITLAEMSYLGSDDDWDYYEDHTRIFGNISLRSSSHTIRDNTWAGKLADGVVDIDALADAIVARLVPAGGTEGQVLGPSGWTDSEGGRLAFAQVGRDSDVDYEINGRLTDTTVDTPTIEGLYGVSFSDGGKIHTITLSGLKSKSSSNRSFPTVSNSYTFDDDTSSSASPFYLGHNTATKKITAAHRAASQDETFTLYLIAAT